MFWSGFWNSLLILTGWTQAEKILTLTSSGPIQGRIQQANGRNYGVYIGIPYAQPPVGALRLRDPMNMLPWTSVLDATGDFKPSCPQSPFRSALMNEDCLYLNIFTPVISAADGRLFPVLFWVHGGYLISGSASHIPTDGLLKNFVSKDVIVVTINYRLGALDEIPGNFGFLDQTMALEWVQRNIRPFGGDKSKVTIAGQSAGAISISALTLSRWSQNLFSQAIMMSGSLLYQNLMDDDPTVDVSQQLGEQLHCWGPTRFPNMTKGAADRSTLNCMQSAAVKDIVETPVTNPANTRPWMARVDKRFFTDSPSNMAKNRPNIRVMIGTTKDEYGILSLSTAPGRPGPEIRTTPAEIAQKTIPDWITSTKFGPKFGLARTLAQYHYISQKSNEAASLDASELPSFWYSSDTQLKSSLAYFIPTYLDSQQYLTNQNGWVYLYSFDHETSIFLDGEFFWKGAYHASELYFLFNNPPKNSTAIAYDIGTKEQIRNITNVLSDCWTNFIKFGKPTQGNPSQDWRPTDMFLDAYYSISSNSSGMQGSYRRDMKEFWLEQVPMITGVKPS